MSDRAVLSRHARLVNTLTGRPPSPAELQLERWRPLTWPTQRAHVTARLPGRFGMCRYRFSSSASRAAARVARAMMVSCGFTLEEDGKRLASATTRLRMP